MLTWYSNLYIGNNVKRKADGIIRKLDAQKKVSGIYLITLARNKHDQLEIISAYNFIQPILYKSCPMIIGIAKGYEEALDMVVQITQESVDKTGTAEVRRYLLTQG